MLNWISRVFFDLLCLFGGGVGCGASFGGPEPGLHFGGGLLWIGL